MNIIQRNFFRLLRAGAYGSEEQIEPMSAWKWRQAFVYGQKLGVAPLLYDGVQQCSSQFFMQLTDEQDSLLRQECTTAEQHYEEAQADVAELLSILGNRQLRPVLLGTWVTNSLYPIPSHHHAGTVNIYFPFATQGNKADDWAKGEGTETSSEGHLLRYQWRSLNVEHRHRMFQLSNKINDMTLQDIIKQEWLDGGTSYVVIGSQRIETIGPTLNMLICLLSIVRKTLTEGPVLRQMVDMGILLRRQGDRVDFVKLQEWIERLHFTRMAQVVGMILTGLLGFSADEVPFMKEQGAKEKDADSLAADVLGENPRSTAKYIRYCPGESISSVVASLTHSLGNVEE